MDGNRNTNTTTDINEVKNAINQIEVNTQISNSLLERLNLGLPPAPPPPSLLQQSININKRKESKYKLTSEEIKEQDDEAIESTILDAYRRGNSIMIEKKKQFTLDIKKRYIVKELLDPNNIFSQKINYSNGFQFKDASPYTILNGINHFFQE